MENDKTERRFIGVVAFAALIALSFAAGGQQPATPPAVTVATTSPESTEAERWAIQVVYAKKCSADLPPTFVFASVLNLEGFPADVAQAAYDKAEKDYYRGPSSWCFAFGIPIRRLISQP